MKPVMECLIIVLLIPISILFNSDPTLFCVGNTNQVRNSMLFGQEEIRRMHLEILTHPWAKVYIQMLLPSMQEIFFWSRLHIDFLDDQFISYQKIYIIPSYGPR